MKIAVAQINCYLGDIEKNSQIMIQHYKDGVERGCNLIVFPELSLSGYLVKDSVFSKQFMRSIDDALLLIAKETEESDGYILLGTPLKREGNIYNAAVLIGKGEIIKEFYKRHLPNYGIFDEKRIFNAGEVSELFVLNDVNIGCLICEDLWHGDVILDLKNQGAELVISINASPFDLEKQEKRFNVIKNAANKVNLPIIYVNRIGSDDYLVFDGGSCTFAKNSIIVEPRYWEENFTDVEYKDGNLVNLTKKQSNRVSQDENIYNALMSGLGDFLAKNNFNKVILGLSGGIDSSFVATLASDVVGPLNVTCIAMPSMFSSESSLTDAQDLIKKLGCKFNIIPINEIYLLGLSNLRMVLGNLPFDVTEENLQSRLRSMFLMAISNKTNALLLSTSNKSESAVGYTTLYGDMCGAIAPISDIYKTKIYQLTNWRNFNIPNNSKNHQLHIINDNIINKPPSAELRENQKDEDSLPPYNILDKVLYNLIELNLSPADIAKNSHINLKLIKKIEYMLINSEFKKEQSPIGIKISTRMLSTERRFPITFKNPLA